MDIQSVRLDLEALKRTTAALADTLHGPHDRFRRAHLAAIQSQVRLLEHAVAEYEWWESTGEGRR